MDLQTMDVLLLLRFMVYYLDHKKAFYLLNFLFMG